MALLPKLMYSQMLIGMYGMHSNLISLPSPYAVAWHSSSSSILLSLYIHRHFEGFIAPLDRMLGALPEPQQSKEEDVALVQKISWLLSVLLEWQVGS